MSSKTEHFPGILTITLDSTQQNVDLSIIIKQQNLLLQNVRVEMTDAAAALAAQVLYIDLPMWQSALMVDDNVGHYYLPILLGETTVTLQNTLQLPVHLKSDIPQSFSCRVLDRTFGTPTGFVSITLQFSFDGQTRD